MKYTTEKPTEPGGYWVDGMVHQLFESSVNNKLYWVDRARNVCIDDLPNTTQYCLISEPGQLDKKEKEKEIIFIVIVTYYNSSDFSVLGAYREAKSAKRIQDVFNNSEHSHSYHADIKLIELK